VILAACGKPRVDAYLRDVGGFPAAHVHPFPADVLQSKAGPPGAVAQRGAARQ
jgi:hypothetical protein